MPKPRRKKKKPDHCRHGVPGGDASTCSGCMLEAPRRFPEASEVTAEFVNVPTPELVIIDDLEMVTNLDVRGRFVKVSPMIPASQRESFDGPRIVTALLEAGALSVILAPTFLSETKKSAGEIAQAPTDRDAVKVWFAAQTLADPEDLEDAKTLVLDFMDAEGM